MEDALPTPVGPLVYIHVRAKPTVLVTVFYSLQWHWSLMFHMASRPSRQRDNTWSPKWTSASTASPQGYLIEEWENLRLGRPARCIMTYFTVTPSCLSVLRENFSGVPNFRSNSYHNWPMWIGCRLLRVKMMGTRRGGKVAAFSLWAKQRGGKPAIPIFYSLVSGTACHERNFHCKLAGFAQGMQTLHAACKLFQCTAF